jgi:hypothetical protein
MTIRPFVFIGLGGTGGKTLSVMYDLLGQRLAQAGIREWPKSWQLLHVDVASHPDPSTAGMPGTLPRRWYHPLTTDASTYPGVDEVVDKGLRLTNLSRHHVWNSWRPWHPDQVPVQIYRGAGQWRALGRVALQAGLDKVADRIAQCFTEIKQAPAQELRTIQLGMGTSPQERSAEPLVFIIGSVAGGSGSGMLLDICDLVRAARLGRPNAVVFAPEVFEVEGQPPDGGLAPNTFMAMHELTNAMWTFLDKDTHTSRDELFARGRVAAPIGQGGPETVLLVGRGSSGFEMSTPEEVYRAVGRALGELVLDEDLTGNVDAFLKANGPATAAMGTDYLGLSPSASDRDNAHLRAIGFGRLTVGRDLFERYAVQRFLRLCSERLLYKHLELRVPGDDRTDLEILTAAVDNAWPRFLVDSRLAEVNPANVVTDSIRPPHQGYAQQLRSKILTDLDALVDKRGRVGSLAAQRVIRDAFSATDEDTGVFTAITRDIQARARAWWPMIQDQLAELVVTTVGREGLPVTRELLRQLKANVTHGADELLTKDAPKYETSVQTQLGALSSLNAASAEHFKIGDTDAVEALLEVSDRIVEDIVRNRTAKLTGLLLTDLAANLLQPWIEAVDDSHGLLARRLEPAAGASELQVWPGPLGVPDHLRPSRVELSLDPVDEFPAVFDRLVTASVRSMHEVRGQRTGAAVNEILRGAEIPKTTEVAPVHIYRVGWVPRDENVRDPHLQVTRASVRLRYAVDDLQERTFGWMRDSQKSIGRFLRHTLADWLTDAEVNAAELDRRQEVLRAQFTQLLKVSPPLIKIDTVLHNTIHAAPEPTITSYVSKVNVPASLTELRAQLLDIQTSIMGPPATLEFSSAGSSSMQLMSFIKTPVHVVEVESVMGPLTRAWLGQTHRPSFWHYRRARPLSEWVPLSPQARRNLVLGWFTARLLGAAKTGWVDGSLRLLVHSDSGWTSLPGEAPRPIHRDYAVGSLLEILPVAFMDCYNDRDLTPLEPFTWLIRLGAAMQPYRSTGGTQQLNPIARVVQEGRGLIDPTSSKLAPLAPSPEERLADVLEQVTVLETAFAADAAVNRLNDLDSVSLNPALEIHGDITWALEVIRKAAHDVQQDGDR